MTDWITQAMELVGNDKHWRLNLSNLLGINKRTIARWVSGENEIPQEVVEKINAMWRIKNDKI